MKFSFIKNKTKFLCLPLAIIVAGIIGLVINGGFNMDIDFAGGIKLEANLSMKLDEEALAKQEAEAAEAETTEEAAETEEATEETTEDTATEEAAAETEEDDIYANIDKFQAEEQPYKTVETNVSNDEVLSVIEAVEGIANIKIQKTGDSTYLIKATASKDLGEDPEQIVLDNVKVALTEKYELSNAAFLSESKTTPTFGAQIQSKAVVFTLIAMLCILLYIAFRFEWRSAVMAIIALFINVLVMCAVYGFTQIPLNTTFIAALLTVVGYSINDTIVIFDRIRENTKKSKSSVSILDIVDNSINECLGRTISTSLTTLITIVMLYILGVTAIRDFALPLIIGITIGTFTSICFAAPFWASWKETDRLAKLEAAKANSKKKK